MQAALLIWLRPPGGHRTLLPDGRWPGGVPCIPAWLAYGCCTAGSPHPDVFRVSNDRLEGCTGGWDAQHRGPPGAAHRSPRSSNCSSALLSWELRPPHATTHQPLNKHTKCSENAGVGRTGWHVDGSFQTAPFSHAIYHIWSCPSKGDTGWACGLAGRMGQQRVPTAAGRLRLRCLGACQGGWADL